MKFQAITQIVLVLVAVVIVVFVVKPKLSDISTKQAEVERYGQAVEKATQYNNKLASLINKAKSFSRTDISALEAYLPTQIDVLQVSRDIQSMVTDSGLLLENIEVSEQGQSVSDSLNNGSGGLGPIGDPAAIDSTVADPAVVGMGLPGTSLLDEARRNLVSTQFTLSALGTYDQFKQLLMSLESNKYPLRLQEMDFEVAQDSDLVDYSLTVETYALTPVNSNDR